MSIALRTATRITLAAALSALFAGCIQMNDQLTIQKDGSGTWKYRVILNPQMSAMMAQKDAAAGDVNIEVGGGDDMPATSREELEKMLADAPGCTITTFEKNVSNGNTTIMAEVAFKSVKELLNSELGESVGWSFRQEGGTLIATAKPLLSSPGDEGAPDAGQFNMMKGMAYGMRINRRLSLPTPPNGGNAQATRDNVAAWDFQINSDTTEAQFKKAAAEPLEYRTTASGITFKVPLSPRQKAQLPRAANGNFSQPLPAQPVNRDAPVLTGATAVAKQVNYSRSRTVQGGNNADIASSQPMQVKMHINWPGGAKLIGYQGPYYTSAKDDQGTNLIPTEHRFHDPDDLQEAHQFGSRPGADITLELATPDRQAKSISAEGCFILTFPGNITDIRIEKIDQYKGKALPNNANLDIRLVKMGGNEINFETTGPAMKLIQDIIGYDAAGKQMPPNGFGTGSTGNQRSFYRSYESGLPETIVFRVADSIKHVKVPFKFDNLELP